MFIGQCVVSVEPYFSGDGSLYELEGYYRGRLAVEEKLASRVLMSFARSSDGMAGYCVVEWLLAKQKQQNGALLIDVADDGGKNDCGARCSWCQIGMMVGGEQNREEDPFLQNDLIDDDEFELLLKLLSLRSVFSRWLSALSK